MRIASLVPSTTEIVWALGHGTELVARTHECDHPAGVESIPAVTGDLLPAGMAPGDIDAAVAASVHDAHTIYALDEEALGAATPEVVLTQDTCAVCAVDRPTVDAAVCTLPGTARVVAFNPTTLEEIVAGVADIARALDDERAGLSLRSHLGARLDWLARRLADRTRPRVAAVEWPDPVYAPGHWVPGMIEAAGGISVLGDPGGSSVRTTLTDLSAARPELVVMAFCGYPLETTILHTDTLIASPEWSAAGLAGIPVAAFDGSGYFSRPGPRVVDGVEALAWLLHRPHPDVRPPPGVGAIRRDGSWIDLADVPAQSGTPRFSGV